MKMKRLAFAAVFLVSCSSLTFGRSRALPPALEFPEEQRSPYISTYYVEPTVLSGRETIVRFFVTDWDNSLVRFGDNSHRFDVTIRYWAEGKTETELVIPNLKSGDHEKNLGVLPVGDYTLSIKCTDQQGRDSHTVIHEFRVRTPESLVIPADKIRSMTETDLGRYDIRNDGDLGHLFPVEVSDTSDQVVSNALEAAVRANAATIPPKGYRVYVATDHEGTPVVRACWKSCVVYGAQYDKDGVESTADRTSQGLQRLLNDAASAGYRKFVFIPGTYRVSAYRTLEIPNGMTVDLNGATIKMNEFTGCNAVIVRIRNGHDTHVVNGTVEGDYYEHDYAHSPKGSEWVHGIVIDGDSRYSSFERIHVLNITGYGGTCGFYGTFPGSTGYHAKNYQPGALRLTDGMVDTSAKYQFTGDFCDISTFQDKYITVSKFLGYQGCHTRSWLYTAAFYDENKHFISAERAHQYRVVLIPQGAKYMRITIVLGDISEADRLSPENFSGQLFCIPWNCAFRKCKFDRCRAVGLAPAAMRNMLIADNEFLHSGEVLAKCAFDAEDGWDMMQDVFIRNNHFHDNPFSEIVVCGGHNVVVENNVAMGGGVNIWGRSCCPCVRSNRLANAVFNCESRKSTMHARYPGNTYANSINLGPCQVPTDWDIVLNDETIGDPNGETIGKPTISTTSRGRVRHCDITHAEFYGDNLDHCDVKDSRFYSLTAGFYLDGDLFKRVAFNHCNMTGTWDNCTLDTCEVYSSTGGDLTLRDCNLIKTSYDIRNSTQTVNLVMTNCVIDLGSKKNAIWTPLYSVGNWSLIGNTFRGTNPNGSLIEIYDGRPQIWDAVAGLIAIAGNTVETQLKSLIKVSDLFQTPAKSLSVVAEGNTLPPNTPTINLDDLPESILPYWESVLGGFLKIEVNPGGLPLLGFSPP